MTKRVLICLLTICIAIGLASCTPPVPSSTLHPNAPTVEVSYIDVGQGDSIYVQLPKGRCMLIDAGAPESERAILNFLKKKNCKKIDYLVATHPHADHIGSMKAVISQFEIGEIYMPHKEDTTQTFTKLLEEIKNKGYKVKTAAGGMELLKEDKLSIQFLAPNGTEYTELNNYSAIIKIIYGDIKFLLTGDAEDVSENEMIAKGYDLSANVLKVGHHGSGTSTTAAFLGKVKPTYAIISCGAGNTYGHPASTTLARLTKGGIRVLRTDLNGTVTAKTDGTALEVKSER